VSYEEYYDALRNSLQNLLRLSLVALSVFIKTQIEENAPLDPP